MITFRSYGTARDALVGELLKDAAAHEAGRFDEIGRRADRLQLPLGGPPGLTTLRAALTFWERWIDARNRGWQPDGNIAKAEWPMLARRVASDLAKDREISDNRVSGEGAGAGAGMRTALGVAYLAVLVVTAILAFLAFGPLGLLACVPTGLWLAPGLRTRVRRAGNITDGVVGWPGLTALVSGAASLGILAVGGYATAGVWLASFSAAAVLELARARVAQSENLRVESAPAGPRRW